MKTVEQKTTDIRRISDLPLASYLVALDIPLIAVEGPPTRREFVFKNVPDAVLLGYYSGEATVSVRKLFGAYRDLKGLTVQMR